MLPPFPLSESLAEKEAKPPFVDLLAPADTLIFPEVPVRVGPALMMTLPLEESEEEPDSSFKCPALPLAEDPEDSVIEPAFPETAFPVSKKILPLVPWMTLPVCNCNVPVLVLSSPM